MVVSRILLTFAYSSIVVLHWGDRLVCDDITNAYILWNRNVLSAFASGIALFTDKRELIKETYPNLIISITTGI